MGLIDPEPVKMGEKVILKKLRGKYRLTKVPVCGYYVPFLKCLQRLLDMPEISDIICRGEFSNRQDVQDGLYLQTHEYLKLHKDALLFSLYTDDFEIVNPIGSHHTVHKLTIYYFQLLNIPPLFRSKLSAIQLLAVAKTDYIKKWGCDKLMEYFVRDLNKLHNGVMLRIAGRQQMCFGLLVYVTGDTLAAQAIGALKKELAQQRNLAEYVKLLQIQWQKFTKKYHLHCVTNKSIEIDVKF